MGKNRELNPADKLRREQKEKERRKNKNMRTKNREITSLRMDPEAIQEEIRKIRRDLAHQRDGDEGVLILRRNLKRLQDDLASAVRARKKVDPRIMERMGIDPLAKNFDAEDPLNPVNGGESRSYARNRALNRPNAMAEEDPLQRPGMRPGDSSYDSALAGPAIGPSFPSGPVQKPIAKSLTTFVPSSLRKKPKTSPAAGRYIDVAPPVAEEDP